MLRLSGNAGGLGSKIGVIELSRQILGTVVTFLGVHPGDMRG